MAVGSLASSGILLKDVAIGDAAFAMVVLGLCQWGTTRAVIQAPWIARAIKPTPQLLVHRGEMLKPALRRERISTDELYGRLREHGFSDLAAVKWVVLETDGRMTVIPEGGDKDLTIDPAELPGNVRGTDGMQAPQERIPGPRPRRRERPRAPRAPAASGNEVAPPVARLYINLDFSRDPPGIGPRIIQ